MIDSQEPDWGRERLKAGEWSPGKRLLCCIRDYQRYQHEQPPLCKLRSAWAVLRHRFWSAVSGADIPLNSQLGGGLLLPHPNGVVIHPDAIVGPNCLIFQQVTLGSLESGGTPVIGGHVDIGAGAKVLGGVVIGDHAKIGANAVVLDDVPAGSVAVGAPARCLTVNRGATSHA
jgi:serine O-acetyltransferase